MMFLCSILFIKTSKRLLTWSLFISGVVPLRFQTLGDCKTEVFDAGNVVRKASLIKCF